MPLTEVIDEIEIAAPIVAPRQTGPAKLPRKKLIRRHDVDYSQRLRLGVQLLFLALNVWVGTQFYLWVRWAERGGVGVERSRPAGVEGWLPIEGLMQLKYFLLTGAVPRIHPAGFFLFLSFLAISFFFRKSFCSWLCPVGTFSEYLWKLGRYTFRRNFHLPRWADIPLRSLKYLLLGFFVAAILPMSAAGIAEFLGSPYAAVVDVRMLNFFRYLDGFAGITVLLLIVASVLVENFWCRYLCPYGAFLGLAALLSPTRIRRNASTCIDCGKCAKACPSSLPVDKLVQIRSAECTACLECVAVCPAEDTLAIKLALPVQKPRTVPAAGLAAAVLVIFLTGVSYAKLSHHWNTKLPKEIYLQLVQQAEEQAHPSLNP